MRVRVGVLARAVPAVPPRRAVARRLCERAPVNEDEDFSEDEGSGLSLVVGLAWGLGLCDGDDGRDDGWSR